jgi:hypothetical protein
MLIYFVTMMSSADALTLHAAKVDAPRQLTLTGHTDAHCAGFLLPTPGRHFCFQVLLRSLLLR